METESQKSICEITDAMKDLLLDKNKKYGDAALKPRRIFYKGSATDSIKVRLDDKMSRVINSGEIRVNDICDLIGYLTLLLISMGVKKEDIEKLKD